MSSRCSRARMSRIRATFSTEEENESTDVVKTSDRSRSRESERADTAFESADNDTGKRVRSARVSDSSSGRFQPSTVDGPTTHDKPWWERATSGYALFIRMNIGHRQAGVGELNLELKNLSVQWQGMRHEERMMYDEMAKEEAVAGTGALNLLGSAESETSHVFVAGANHPSASSGNSGTDSGSQVPPVFMAGANHPSASSGNGATDSGSQVPPVFMAGASASSGNEQRGNDAATASGSQVPPVAQAGTPVAKSLNYWYGGLLSFGRIRFD